MYKLLFAFFIMIFFVSCGLPMFDIPGKGSLNKHVYYDVASNQVISKYNDSISSIILWKYTDQYKWNSGDDNDSTFSAEEIPAPATNTFTIPKLKDSIAYYDFEVAINFKNDHWRMIYHLNIDREKVKKKQKIYSRFTSH